MTLGEPAWSTMVIVAVTRAAPVWSTTLIFKSAGPAASSSARAGAAARSSSENNRSSRRAISGKTYEPFFTKDSGLSAGFTLNLSIVHSSVTLPLAPVVMRCGSRTPSTFLYSL